jgi:hypothetical protein
MGSICNVRRALQTGFACALLGALSIVAGCMAGDTADETTAVTQDAILRVGQFACIRGGTEQWTLAASPDGNCVRFPGWPTTSSMHFCVGGACPSCKALADTLQ